MAESSLRIVLDTNVLLVSVSSRSKYHWIFQALLEEKYELLLSNEILLEYEEVITQKLGAEVARNVVRTLILLPNVLRIDPFYSWNLIAVDPDDNKFVDCSVAANAHALVTQDRHFDVLEQMEFPRLTVLRIEAFRDLLENRR